jgi:ring-1,2-phenylacetyl-CoA epoxidase subunit PaaD
VVSTTIGIDDLTEIRSVIASVTDPEIPVLTIDDLGILRDVSIDDGRVVVTITPTYSGCPAMDAIREAIVGSLPECEVAVRTVHSPAWTTDWMSAEGRRKLEEYGIAAPSPAHEARCPRCRAAGARTVSFFGSTACKAMLVCSSCGEPFDLFKEL